MLRMIPMTKVELAIAKPTAWATTLITVTVAPPITTYTNMKISKPRISSYKIISRIKNNFFFGRRMNKYRRYATLSPTRHERVVTGDEIRAMKSTNRNFLKYLIAAIPSLK